MVGAWYVLFRSLGLYNTHMAVILAHAMLNLPIGIWLMATFIREVPREIIMERAGRAASGFAALGVAFWQWVNSTVGAIFGGVGLAWVAAELALGPTAGSRIRTTGASVDLPLVARTRRARKVLAKIDVAVRASRGVVEQPTAPVTSAQPAEPSVQTNLEAPSGTVSIADATHTNGS